MGLLKGFPRDRTGVDRLRGLSSFTSFTYLPSPQQALVAAVDHDLHLITERVGRLTGAQGLARLGAALTAARAAAAAQLPPPAAASTGEAEHGSPPTGPQALSRSPSQSPIKKAPRSAGQYSGDSSAAAGATSAGHPPATATPEPPPGLLHRSSSAASAMSVSYSGGEEAAALDVEAGLSQHANLALVWHLLYDPQWQVSPVVLCALVPCAGGCSEGLGG